MCLDFNICCFYVCWLNLKSYMLTSLSVIVQKLSSFIFESFESEEFLIFERKKKLTKVRLKCNYLNYANSYYRFLNKIWHCFNWRKNLCPVTSIKNIMLYPLLTDKNYHDDNLNESCLPLTPSKNLSYLFN